MSAAVCILALLGAGCASKAPEPAPAPEPTPAPPAPAARPAPPPVAEPAPAPEVRETAPQRYVVQRGDTLWDISNMFLLDPWYWPEIWYVNPQIENPHLIFPGDVISLYYVDGRPRLMIDDGPRVRPTERLAPHIRTEPLPPVAEMPIQSLHQFLIRPRVVSEEELDQAAYILASQDDRLVFGANDRLYVRGMADATEEERYSIFRKGAELRDPGTDELLGFEAIPVGDAEVVRSGDPTTVTITRSDREALKGDRLLPLDANDQDFVFTPHTPPRDVDGRVVSLFDAISQIARFQVAVVNLGERNGIEQGHVLATYQTGRVVQDQFAGGTGGEAVRLPDERIGLMMVFRTFDKVSYALVMESTRPIQVGDALRHP